MMNTIMLTLMFRARNNKADTYFSQNNCAQNIKYYLLLLSVLFVLQTGCSHTLNPDLIAQKWGYEKKTVKGVLFQHTLFIKKAIKKGDGRSIHIYLGGDGRPWQTPTRIALDPTPKNPLMLKLMALDGNQAIYLGRPCYYESYPPCAPVWWSFWRYSEDVVDSMAAVLERYTRSYDSIVLMGHSGGGTLAMLLAQRLTKTSTIVTLAGNLDIEAWTKHHGYTSLLGSLNPATQPPLSKTIRQYHYLGTEDANIHAVWIKPVIDRQTNATLHMIDNADHNCCWGKLWPEILKQLAALRQDSPSAPSRLF